MAAVRLYLRYNLFYRDVEELLLERGVEVDHVDDFPAGAALDAVGQAKTYSGLYPFHWPVGLVTICVDTGQRPGTPDNPAQDRIVVLNHATVVLGGAPSWAPWERDGRWYADVLADELPERLQWPGDHRSLTERLADAIQGVVARA